MMKNMDMLLIGAGLYVSGKGTDGYGTILPAIFESKRDNKNIGDLYCVSTTKESSQEILKKSDELICKTGVVLSLEAFPKSNKKDLLAYRSVIRNLDKPACAIIAVPDHLHYEIAKECLEAGLHTLIVKPFTPTSAEGLELVNLADNLGLYGAVEFHKRWDKSNLLLRDKFISGEIGSPLNCWVEYSQRKSLPLSFFKEWAAKTSILQYLGVHYIDLIRFVTGATPLRVMAIGQKSEIIKQKIDTYDSIQCVIEWEMEDGSTFTETILTSWVDPESSSAISDQKIKFIGTKGRYEADQKERGITINTEDNGLLHLNPDFCMPYGVKNGSIRWRGYGIESIKTFLNDVVALENGHIALSTLHKERPSFRESLISTLVVEAAHASLRDASKWKSIKIPQ